MKDQREFTAAARDNDIYKMKDLINNVDIDVNTSVDMVTSDLLCTYIQSYTSRTCRYVGEALLHYEQIDYYLADNLTLPGIRTEGQRFTLLVDKETHQQWNFS